MLIFYRENENHFTGWVERKLNEMVVAHKLVPVHEHTSLPARINRNRLPVLSDGHKQWTIREDIKDYLNDLHKDLKLSRSLQSDACHLDPDNPERCL